MNYPKIKRSALLNISIIFFIILISSCLNNNVISTTSTVVATTTTTTIYQSSVEMTDKGNYYQITIDLTKGASHYQAGIDLGNKIKQNIPDFASLIDSYIYYITSNGNYYQTIISRIPDIKPQIPQDFIDEIDGMSSVLCDSTLNQSGDNKISKDELYFMNIILDIAKTSQCSAISVFGNLSDTGKTITGRVLDWDGGQNNQLPKIQAVTTIKNGSKSITLVGYAGYLAGLTVINDDKLFAAILESTTGETYSSVSKRSYSMDLRYAMENYNTVDDVANYLSDTGKKYTAGHLFFLSDPDVSKVLENNLTKNRIVRTFDTLLNVNISWGFNNAIAAVNSFIIKGNYDNHTGSQYNYNRWASIKSQLTSKITDNKVTINELKDIICYKAGALPSTQSNGDIYNTNTQMIVVFQPDTLSLEVFFRPKTGVLPSIPMFDNVNINF